MFETLYLAEKDLNLRVFRCPRAFEAKSTVQLLYFLMFSFLVFRYPVLLCPVPAFLDLLNLRHGVDLSLLATKGPYMVRAS
jgi:hypothetical protein